MVAAHLWVELVVTGSAVVSAVYMVVVEIVVCMAAVPPVFPSIPEILWVAVVRVHMVAVLVAAVV